MWCVAAESVDDAQTPTMSEFATTNCRGVRDSWLCTWGYGRPLDASTVCVWVRERMEGRSLIHVLPYGIVCVGEGVVGGCDVGA